MEGPIQWSTRPVLFWLVPGVGWRACTRPLWEGRFWRSLLGPIPVATQKGRVLGAGRTLLRPTHSIFEDSLGPAPA